MSLPVATYKCTACQLNCREPVTWGYRYYLCATIKVSMSVTTGWCHCCDGIAAIEVLPTAIREAELQKEVEVMQMRLNEEHIAPISKTRWWQWRGRKTILQSRLKFEIKWAEERLAEYRLRRATLSNRTSLARCLRCSSENCASLPPHEIDYFDPESVPSPVGFKHPGCGGDLLVMYDGTRLSLVMSEKAYDFEGRRLEQDFAPG